MGGEGHRVATGFPAPATDRLLAMATTAELLAALQAIDKRAERTADEYVVATYVDDPSLVGALTASDNGIISGRRGTGKTHALKYLAETRRKAGEGVVYIDMEQDIGSTEGRYVDPSLSLEERATRLVVDVLSIVHDAFLEAAFNGRADASIELLDRMLDHFREVVVRKEIAQSDTLRDSQTIEDTAKGEAKLGLGAASLSLGLGSQTTTGRSADQTVSGSGPIRHRISFGGISGLMRQFLDGFASKRFWILLDEWSGIPLDLQPFLAEMIRKLFFGHHQVTVRIGAIPHRTNWRVPGDQGQYLGIEVGAELFWLLDLDEFVVFPARTGVEQARRSRVFFQNLIFRHLNYALSTMESQPLPDISAMMSLLFTQVTALNELVRAAEGVPRDALNILGRAALRSGGEKISVNHVRQAAAQLYLTSKATQLNGVPGARDLLEKINEDVIGVRKARAFLLDRDHTSHPLIQKLVDDRLLHIIKQGYSSKDEPGKRYDVLQIDYGCYVHLLGTAAAPIALIEEVDEDHAFEAFYGEVYGGVNVPEDDYRAIRRAVLDLPSILDALQPSPPGRHRSVEAE
ncbi:ORC-CDC6 family AAA ATPase [Mycobacterium malmoense]|uniref:ORC-CDC6 family AAA ATPase n=1 Tax=Mycobacterium malmoense TaxID=1780 RepID=UPI001146822B|nr:hypothetical protein [Mycobacterium malmoense]